jgi:methylmalonyl-CoA mutase
MPVRVVTAAALFDGHDVSINLFRRLLQKRGAEVIHLGHNRSVSEIIKTAIEEDADAILISSYQGGHNEFFRYTIDKLRELQSDDILVFGGGGGVILPSEIADLEKYGVERIYHATDGQKLGIDGIADDIMNRIITKKKKLATNISKLFSKNNDIIAFSKLISVLENGTEEQLRQLRELLAPKALNHSVVIGVTGTGGSGKSSVIDEIVGRLCSYTHNIRIAIFAVDPTKSTTGGALLGDRIRYNQIYNDRVYFRSFATRQNENELSSSLYDAIKLAKAFSYDLIFVETSGIGQGNSKVAEISDLKLYVMTAEFGAPSQLEKIDMLDIADFIAINKFEKIGSEDAFREVSIHYLRSRNIRPDKSKKLEELGLPIYATSSNKFNNAGINKLFLDLVDKLNSDFSLSIDLKPNTRNILDTNQTKVESLISHKRINYLSDIAQTVRDYHRKIEHEAEKAQKLQAAEQTLVLLQNDSYDEKLIQIIEKLKSELSKDTLDFLSKWDLIKEKYLQDEFSYRVDDREVKVPLNYISICGSQIPKVATPQYKSYYELVKFFYKENLPGYFPFTAGVFPLKRTYEDPKRQFAGEGSPERTNKRFHFLCKDDKAKRLSVAFDGITLYAEDPVEQPDIYGKIGESGVSVCNIDDMDKLFEGFDLTDPLTSVSMTINAPAPIMVAFYFLTAYKRELKKLTEQGIELSPDEKNDFRISVFRRLRGTVQADMLKEDQGQNTCIFSIDFAMKLIGDLQEYLSKNKIKNYYSLSISGYHIAEAGANPITQLAFTLANGFTYVEYFLNRGIPVDDFAPNLSFFFSNGMDPEYSVIGRVARRIWAVAMKYRYGANERSQKLKYHIQTSGRSLHAQEIDFNDIRTTLQGLLAFYDNCNSLHTNSYDEAVTTPTEESVRRSMAIQLILSKEFGMLKNENPNQGSFIIEYLTDLVEEAVLEEFDRLSRRGGVLGAMETQYQRSKIQEESMYYEMLKQSGEYPIIGVNTFINENAVNSYDNMKITRASIEEKNERLRVVNEFKDRHKDKAALALEKLKNAALSGGNIFEELLETVEHATMGQITQVLYEIGGKYRRGM